MRTLERFDASCTASAAGRASERSPWLAEDVVVRGHEISCHSCRWERPAEMPEAHEREVIAKAVDCIRRAVGVVVGLALYVAFVLWLRTWLIGVPLIGR